MPDNSAYGVVQPEEAMSYDDFWKQNAFGGLYKDNPSVHAQDLGSRFIGMFGENARVKDAYETYLKNLDMRNSYQATQAANQWNAIREDSTMQRAVQDYEKAGLNPYLLLNSGSVGTVAGNSANVASYNSSRRETNTKSDKGRNAALILLAVARLVAALV